MARAKPIKLTDAQRQEIKMRYPHEQSSKIAADMGLPLRRIYTAAAKLNLEKTAECLAATNARRNANPSVLKNLFKKGNVPPQKGKKGWNPPGSEKGWFKKGEKSLNWKPVGSERTNVDGYRERKVAETGYPPKDWRPVHQLIWLEAGREIPKGHLVVFRDGDKTNLVLDNLECISRTENMRRNTVHNLPEEIKEVVYLKSAIAAYATRLEKKKK